MTLRARLREAVHSALSVLVHAPSAQLRALVLASATFKSSGGESWAEQDAVLWQIEHAAVLALLAQWAALETITMADLGLAELTSLDGAIAYRFSAVDSLTKLLLNQQAFISSVGAADAPLLQKTYAAWLRGVINAENELRAARAAVPAAAPVTPIPNSVRDAYRASLRTRGLELVRNGTIRTYRQAIVDKLVSGDFDGMSPREVARKLKAQFDAGDYNWQRLARSEIAQAQCHGKMAQYKADGIERVNYVTARDSKVSQICRDLAKAGPYPIDEAPVPVTSSHPNCRCTVTPVLDDDDSAPE